MSSKRLKKIVLGVFLLIAIPSSIGFLLLITDINLKELAKPPIIKHSQVVSSITIINYPKPELTVDDKILRDLDCPFNELSERYCDAISDQGQSESQGCFSISTPNSSLGGLEPVYPLAECSQLRGRKYIYSTGCIKGSGDVFIVERQGKYERIDSLSKLKSIYAPIESENEALSYAIAATGYSAYYEIEVSPDTEYFVEKLENTHVETREDEYIVRLFEYRFCGCGQHQTIAIDVAVNHKGNIHEVYREVVFRDANWICID